LHKHKKRKSLKLTQDRRLGDLSRSELEHVQGGIWFCYFCWSEPEPEPKTGNSCED
jgi:hypothetical protein